MLFKTCHYFIKNLRFSHQAVKRNVKIYEVGPRDGLQNQKNIISSEDKIKMINMLSDSGIKEIEVTSIVSPKWVPQLADYDKILKSIKRNKDVAYSILIPNAKGFLKSLEYEINRVAVVSSASDQFSLKNMNCNIEKSLERIKDICDLGTKHNVQVRGYVSTAFVCPYEGKINPDVAVDVCKKLADMGCYEIVIADTLGAAEPDQVQFFLEKVLKVLPSEKIAVHFHNTYGFALKNVLNSVNMGITKVDSASGGLGGCPYAKSAKGNVGTEDVIDLLKKEGYETNVDETKVLEATRHICKVIGIEPPSQRAKDLLQQS